MIKKIFYFSLILITFFIIYISLNPQYKNYYTKEDTNSPFKISKIIFYSGIIPKNTSFNTNDSWNLDISQYTDIAIYIQSSENLTKSNTIKNLYIDNINFTKKPFKGICSLYYQNPLKFATSTIYSDYVIDNHLKYNILNFTNEENYDYYSTPNFFTDCSIPIVIKYVNSEIIKNYSFSNQNKLVFNGSILKNSNITLKDIDCEILFTINIVANDNQLYKYDINTNIPISTSQYTLFDKDIFLEKEINLPFTKVSVNQ